VGTHVLDSAEALHAAGWEVGIITGELDPEAHPVVAVHIIEGLAASPVSPDVSARLLALLDGPSDVLHVHNLREVAFIDHARGEAAIVISIHNFEGCATGNYYFRPGQECTRAHGRGCWAQMALRGCPHTWRVDALPLRYRSTTKRLHTLRRADAVIAYSDFVATHMRRNDVQAQVVPLVVAPAADRTPPGASRRILFAGRLVKAKGLGVLLGALRGLDAHLDVYGTGWWGAEAQSLARRLDVTDRVTFHGWAGPRELYDAYQRAAVVAVPSLWPEPFGLVGVEALAHGRPVVGTSTGGIPEWLVDGVNGFLVPPGDEGALRARLEELLSRPALRERLGAAGRAMVQAAYSPDAHVDGIASVYAEAARARSARPLHEHDI
jgi:glycosyltransferase involved in cell wall biosynthesis